MARRRRNESLTEVALTSRWPVAAIIAVVMFVFGYIILPSAVRPSPMVAPIINTFSNLLGLVAAVFAFIAVVKFLVERGAGVIQPEKRMKEHGTLAREGEYHLVRSPRPNSISSSNKSTVDQAWHTSLSESANAVSSIDTSTWTMELLRSIEWKRYEDLCAAFYREMGIRSETTPLGADGGIDIRLFQEPDSPIATAVVQCKAWGDKLVGVKPVRELLGVITHGKIPKAFFMAPGGFTDDAREFAKANNITLLDGKLFLAMIERMPAESSQRLLTFATEGDFTTPSCPNCGTKMLKRNGSHGDFWGCRDYPRCKQTMPMRKNRL